MYGAYIDRYMIQFNDNPTIIIDTNPKRNNRRKIIFCVLCKVQLECISAEEQKYICPRCKADYSLYENMIPQEDILESSHEEDSNDNNVGGLLSANDNEFKTNEEEESGKIEIPEYMKPAPGRNVVEYREN